MAAIEAMFEQNTKAILDRIFALNSDAVVVITTIPNPTKDKYLCSLIDVYLNVYNTFIRNGCNYTKGCIRIADCDQAFRSYTGDKALTFTNINWSNFAASSFDPHPTPFGHSLMEQIHYTSLTTDVAATTASATTSNGSTTANVASKTATTIKSTTSIATDVPVDFLTISTAGSSSLVVADIENSTVLSSNFESSASDADTASSKNNNVLIMIIILSLLVLAGVGGFVFYNIRCRKNSEQ
jgi:hypothetical protein